MSYCKCDECIHDTKNGGTEKACEKCIGWSGDQFLFREIGQCIYPDKIMNIVREYLGMDYDDCSRDEEISLMTKAEIFELVLEHEGIIGYVNWIMRRIKEIYDVDLEEIG